MFEEKKMERAYNCASGFENSRLRLLPEYMELCAKRNRSHRKLAETLGPRELRLLEELEEALYEESEFMCRHWFEQGWLQKEQSEKDA